MDLNEIAVFIQVVQTGSFSQAARKLGMPNSTVSSKVSSLEKRLGLTLIQRTTRKLNITPAGKSFFQHCVAGLEEIRAGESELAALKGEPQGLLRITAPVELGGSVLPRLLSEFTGRYPQVTVEMLLTDRRVDLLAESVDLAIRAGELQDSSLIAKKLGSSCFALFASPAYLKARGKPVQPKDLRAHSCLHFTPMGAEEWKLVGPKGRVTVPVPRRVIANDLILIKKLTLQGDGIAYMPTFYCHAEVKAGQLVRVLPEYRSTLNSVHFVYPAQKFVTPKLSAFIELATESLRQIFLDGDD